MDVKKIPVNVQCLLSASARINTYKRAVEELVYNSLDAESTCIAIRIHIQNNWIQVIDNGTGIKKADYPLLGQRYATSKLVDANTLKAVPSKYGYQGQALANIIEVSQTVTVTSRCNNSNDTWVKTYYEGKIARGCFKASLRPSKGTTIDINGFLYNLNLRKKYINAFNELQEIKTFLEHLSLVFNNVSISVRDDSENEIIFKMHKSRDIYQTLKSLFEIDPADVQELQVEKNEYKVKALIGIEKKANKNCHWIYLNNKFVNPSNIHKIINNKFIKPDRVKDKKIKPAVAYKYNEEISVVCKFIPIYFLFITCPYYEYDIVNSVKETSVEFKDWLQINNLIEKLVKFYMGDINLINVQKKVNQKEVVEKHKDTRDEVKEIMEKILGRNNKIPRVTEMKNGIKGKQIKRKRKKQQVNIPLSKILPTKYNTPLKNQESPNKIKFYKNKVIKKDASKYRNSYKQQKSTRKNSSSKNKGNNKSHKIHKTLKCKCNKKHDNLIEIFRNDTNSIKRRCNELSSDIKQLLNINTCEQLEDISFTQMKTNTPVIITKQDKCNIKENEICSNKKVADTLDIKHSKIINKPKFGQIRSYDLLQTVLKTQEYLYTQKSIKEDECMTKSNAQQRTYTKNYEHAPKLTFESHRYKVNSSLIEIKLPQTKKFISKQSKDNFNIGPDKHRDIQYKTGRITKRHGLFNIKERQKHDTCTFNRLLNKYNPTHTGLQSPFSIDLPGTDIVEFSKQIRNQIINDMNSLSLNKDCDKIYNPKALLNFEVNLNIERTYTILIDSLHNSSRAMHMNKNCKSLIDETVCHTNVNYHDKSNAVFRSKQQHSCNLNIDEPLDICEAVLNNSDYSEETFNIISKQDPLLISNKSRHTNELFNTNSANKSEINSSLNKICTRENSVKILLSKEEEKGNNSVRVNNKSLKQLTQKNENIVTNETNMKQDLYNFELNTRHRFVPKGMSQIFKNCFSKNICSYNLDTDYFENSIYNNFVEDVAANSEIFHPKVKNLKEFTAENIQKVTERIKKQNADLIFGTDSLRNAKVLSQVDCKFIAAVIQGVSLNYKSPDFLVFFDQHAVHERIRLETNLSYYFNDNNWKKVTIDTISLKSSKDEILYLHNHKDKFTRFGLEWTVLNNAEILVNAIPEAIRGKNLRSVEIIVKTVKDLILEQMHAIRYLKGNVSLYPQSIMNLVFSEACRYAIKFGDILSLKDCVELIAALAECKTPFQCAHGRPVMAVMVELKNEKIEYKVNMDNVMRFKNRIKK